MTTPLSLWRRARYRELRKQLIVEMGGKCAHCGATWDLEFGHTQPRTWAPNKLNRLQRLRMYRRDWLAGKLQVECCACNKSHRTENGVVKQVSL